MPALATSPSPLGTFGKLPPEVRFYIWAYLMPRRRPTIACPWPIEELDQGKLNRYFDFRCDEKGYGLVAILRSSRPLYDEITSQLYHRELRFRYSTNVRTRRSGWTVNDLPGASCRDFLFANFSRFRKLVFEIECPPADLLGYYCFRLYTKLGDIVNTISDIMQCFVDIQARSSSSYPPRSANLPRIEIVFLDVDTRRWSITAWPSPSTLDIEDCLNRLGYLRRSAGVTIELPEDLRGDEHLIGVVERVKRDMMSESNDLHPPAPGGPWYVPPCYFPEPDRDFERDTPRKLDFGLWYLETLRKKVRPEVWSLHTGENGLSYEEYEKLLSGFIPRK